MKQSGILLHLTSLATDYGIGDLGTAAYRFCDYLKENSHSFWQILPLNHCGYGNSPYNPISAFAYNKFLISPDMLAEKSYLSRAELQAAKLPHTSSVDYEAVYRIKGQLLDLAAERMLKDIDVEEYIRENAWHLKPYLAFTMLSQKMHSSEWYLWPHEIRHYSDKLYDELYQENKLEMRKTAVLQKVFEEQFTRLKAYMTESGVSLIGDLPLYLSYESSEVWAHQYLFDLDESGRRLSVAGVPPDAFSESGQLWGNPIYLWDRIQDSGFEIFIKRFRHVMRHFDLIRLDHFIGYVNYWKINCMNGIVPDSAINGAWVRALPEAFFDTLLSEFPIDKFIAEDLGILNSDVCEVRDRYGFPGMIILQFCFEESVPDAMNFPSDRFIYTGTHDNSTTRGWWDSLPENSPSRLNLAVFCKRFMPEYGLPNQENIHEMLREVARISGCNRYIIPMQDILGLDDEARMNIPGTALGNWQWRL